MFKKGNPMELRGTLVCGRGDPVGGHESDHFCLLESHKATGFGQQLGWEQ